MTPGYPWAGWNPNTCSGFPSPLPQCFSYLVDVVLLPVSPPVRQAPHPGKPMASCSFLGRSKTNRWTTWPSRVRAKPVTFRESRRISVPRPTEGTGFETGRMGRLDQVGDAGPGNFDLCPAPGSRWPYKIFQFEKILSTIDVGSDQTNSFKFRETTLFKANILPLNGHFLDQNGRLRLFCTQELPLFFICDYHYCHRFP